MNENFIVTGETDGNIRVYDKFSGNVLYSSNIHNSKINKIIMKQSPRNFLNTLIVTISENGLAKMFELVDEE